MMPVFRPIIIFCDNQPHATDAVDRACFESESFFKLDIDIDTSITSEPYVGSSHQINMKHVIGANEWKIVAWARGSPI